MKSLNSPARKFLAWMRTLLSSAKGFDEQVHDHILRLDFADVDHAVAQILGRAQLSRFQRETLADGYRHLTDPSDIVVLNFDDGRRDGGLQLTFHALWREGYGAFDVENGIPASWAEVCDIEFAGGQLSVIAA